MKETTYLGDGAYATQGRYLGEFVVYTSNGIDWDNVIYFDIAMIDKMHAWAHQAYQ